MPPGYDEVGADGLSRICVVTKPIYGMAQAGRRWQRDLFAWLISEGFAQLHSDPCVFQKSVTNAEGHVDRLVIGVYVDDLCVAYSGDPDDSSTLYAEFVRNLSARWEVEDEGEITDLLAVQFDFADGKVKLHQSDYIRRLVDEHGSGAKRPSAQGLKTPSDSGSNGLAQQVADAMTESSARFPSNALGDQGMVMATSWGAGHWREHSGRAEYGELQHGGDLSVIRPRVALGLSYGLLTSIDCTNASEWATRTHGG